MEAEMRAEGLGYAFPVVWGSDVKRVWDLRKAGLGHPVKHARRRQANFAH